MKKTNVASLQELRYQDIQNLNDYLEDAFKLFGSDLLSINDGIIKGLNVTQSGASGLVVASGAIFKSGVWGELEGAGSGFVVTLPGAGTRTDVVVASYQEVQDTPGSGYVLLDTTTRIEQVVNANRRKFGSVKLEYLTNTAVAPAGKLLVAKVTCSSGSITAVDNSVKTWASVRNLMGQSVDSLAELAALSAADGLYMAVRDTGVWRKYNTYTDIIDGFIAISASGGGAWVMQSVYPNAVFQLMAPITDALQAQNIESSIIWDAPSVAANSSQTTTLTVTGASLGDPVRVTPLGNLDARLTIRGYVSAVNTVIIQIGNASAGAIDPANLTYKVVVEKW